MSIVDRLAASHGRRDGGWKPITNVIRIAFVVLVCTIAVQAQSPLTGRGPKEPKDARAGLLGRNARTFRAAAYAEGSSSIGDDTADRIERLVLSLRSTKAQESELEALLQAQQDSQSSSYHQWLTPQEFGTRFGLTREDRDSVTAWLSSKGFTVNEISAGGRAIIFSGTAAQVRDTFDEPISGESEPALTYRASVVAPAFPARISALIDGVVGVEQSDHTKGVAGTTLAPQFTYGTSHFLAPSDFATIYNLSPLYASGTNGTGQKIAIAARSNINLSDVGGFRTYFGLSNNLPTVTINGLDPSIVSFDEEAEALLDVEWAGAVAPAAKIDLIVSATTAATDGATLSAEYIVNHNLAPVMVVPFGKCEQAMGISERNYIRNLWQQASTQGMTVIVASGDSGAAGCDGFWQTSATHGRGVNGLCSTPYNVCVGGTQFDEGTAMTDYWSSTNASWGQGSALRYIPETAWNESGANSGTGLYASNGGKGVSRFPMQPVAIAPDPRAYPR